MSLGDLTAESFSLEHGKKSSVMIVNAIGINGKDLCLCGSLKRNRNCCINGTTDLYPKVIEKILGYKKGQGGTIKTIPKGLMDKLIKRKVNQYRCLHPSCNKKTVLCHQVPHNLLKRNFGTHCYEYDAYDDSVAYFKIRNMLPNTVVHRLDELHGGNQSYEERGNGDATTLNVFCKTHDNNLFENIDNRKPSDPITKEMQATMCFKNYAFNLMKNQFLLNAEYQVAVFTPYITVHNLNEKGLLESSRNANKDLDVLALQTTYLKHKCSKESYDEACEVILKKDFDQMEFFARSVKESDTFFMSLVTNPNCYPNGEVVSDNISKISFSLDLYAENGLLSVYISILPSSIPYYKPYLDQLNSMTNEEFRVWAYRFIQSKDSSKKPIIGDTSYAHKFFNLNKKD